MSCASSPAGDSLYVCKFDSDECVVSKATIGANCRCAIGFDKKTFNNMSFLTSHSSKLDYKEVAVYFATDRSYNPDAVSNNSKFGKKRGDFRYGISLVSIPPGHAEGEIERPWNAYVIKEDEDPEEHISITHMKIVDKKSFFGYLSNNDGKSIIVYIHGYNVSHSESLWRAAQLKHDLGFQGEIIAYSWPSNGELIKYTVDEANVQRTEPNLKNFLVDIKDKLNTKKLHVIAHSMGNRAFTRVLHELAMEYDEKIFNQVILAAPDVDAEVFASRIKPAISLAENYTLYGSSDDLPLISSKFVHEYPRAGQGGEDVFLAPDIDTIDASAIKGKLLEHSYFAKELLSDIKIVFNKYTSPSNRGLVPTLKNNIEYWLVPSD